MPCSPGQRAGRTAEAHRVFADARHRLRSELGVDPGPLLRQTHLRLLHGDSAAARSGGRSAAKTR